LSELGIRSMRFHPVAARHIWVDGRFGVLRFRLPIAQAFDFTLYAHVHPLMAERSRATKVLVNGEILEERLFSSTRQSHHFHVPKDLLTEDGITEIALVTPRCFEGKRCRSRNMSLSLSKFSLKLL